MRQITIFAFFIITLQSFGQTRTITGKVLDDALNPLYGTVIMNNENREIGTADLNGDFVIQIPTGAGRLFFRYVGMETAIITIPSTCVHIEIIMIPQGNYHYSSSRKVDRERKSLYDKVPAFHLKAFEKGIFRLDSTCYTREFEPDKPRLDQIRKELSVKSKRVKTLFKKLDIGDTIQVPFSGTYKSDGTDRTTLIPWAYYTDATKSQCLIEGIVTAKDKRNAGYNIEFRVTDCNSCKYDTPIIYQERDMVVGAVFRHNMRILNLLIK
jgi:hypothetical protein